MSYRGDGNNQMDPSTPESYPALHTNPEPVMRIPLSLNLAKTATFAAVHFSVAFGIAYLLTGSVSIAGAIALIEPLANTVAYFFHERAWSRIGSRGPAVSIASRSK